MESAQDLQRGVITMAFGKSKFIEMAKWLGMSIRLNAPDLSTAIITDSSDPSLRKYFTHIIPHTAEMGLNMYPKFQLDRISPFIESLYIDTDCLVLNNLSRLWPLFSKQPIGILGTRYLSATDTDTEVDLAFVLRHFQLERLPKFNGGCYYFRAGPQTTAFFDTTRSILGQAPQLHIGNYSGGGFSDEPMFALALELHHIPLISAAPGGMYTPIGSVGPIHLDLSRQECSFIKHGRKVTPDIVHFPVGFRECFAYHREVWKLKKHFGEPSPSIAARVHLWFNSLIWTIKRTTKNALGR